MNRRAFLAFSLLAVAPTISLAQQKTGKKLFQTLDGTFVGIEGPDLVHLKVRDKAGHVHSFYVGSDSSFDPIVDNPSAYVGKNVSVRWLRLKRHIPEDGPEVMADQAVSIKIH